MDTTTHTNGNGAIGRPGLRRHKFKVKPLYVQVRDDILKRIRAGEFRPGEILPNEGDLARELGVSAGTARKALDELESAGALDRKQGRGTFVRGLEPWDSLPVVKRMAAVGFGTLRPCEEHGVIEVIEDDVVVWAYTAAQMRVLAECTADITRWLDRGAYLKQARAA